MVNSLMTEKSEYMFGYILEKKSSLKRKLLFCGAPGGFLPAQHVPRLEGS